MRRTLTALFTLAMVLSALAVAAGVGEAAATGDRWNFQQKNTPVPSGWKPDHGDLFQASRGYGWQATDGTSRQCGDRNAIDDQVRDTFCHAQARYVKVNGSWQAIDSPASWKANVGAGQYDVTVIVGESKVHPSAVRHSVQIEGVSFVDRATTSRSRPFVEVTKRLDLSDGVLNMTFEGGEKTKVVALAIVPAGTTSSSSSSSSTTTTTKPSSTTTTTTAPTGGGTTLTFFDKRDVTDGTNYIRDNEYVMPVRDLAPYTNKKATMKITVFSKKSTLNTPMQICAWQRGPNGEWKGPGTDETCAALKGPITGPGTYTYTLPEPTTWWGVSGTGNYDWSEQTDAVGIMVKDGSYATQPPLLMYKNCGAACHPKGEAYVKQHTPIDFRAEITFFK